MMGMPEQGLSSVTTGNTRPSVDRRVPYLRRLLRDLKVNRVVYLMLLPVIAYYIVFRYVPMYGVQIAFRDYYPGQTITGSPWVGFQFFTQFFHDYYFWGLLRNTLLLSLWMLAFAFPAPIILALLVNELRARVFKRVVQTVTYLPYFISTVVVIGIISNFLARDGLINHVLSYFGIPPQPYLMEPGWFRPIFVLSENWQYMGFGSVIYLAAITSVDPALYEAAVLDGANRWKQTIHVTIPSIMPTIAIMFILAIGNIMSVNTEKILLLYNPLTYDTADVIGTYIYREGLVNGAYSLAAAVGLFNSVVNFVMLIFANSFSKRFLASKLW